MLQVQVEDEMSESGTAESAGASLAPSVVIVNSITDTSGVEPNEALSSSLGSSRNASGGTTPTKGGGSLLGKKLGERSSSASGHSMSSLTMAMDLMEEARKSLMSYVPLDYIR